MDQGTVVLALAAFDEDAHPAYDAAGLCRHRIGLALAHQLLHAADATTGPATQDPVAPDQASTDQHQWTPGDIPATHWSALSAYARSTRRAGA
jgi:hypothetical protein